MVILGELGNGPLGMGLDVDHLEQQKRVMCGEGAPRLADDVWHREVMLAAGFGQCVHHVVRVLLQRVVDARVRRRVGPVIVDAESAADIEMSDI